MSFNICTYHVLNNVLHVLAGPTGEEHAGTRSVHNLEDVPQMWQTDFGMRPGSWVHNYSLLVFSRFHISCAEQYFACVGRCHW